MNRIHKIVVTAAIAALPALSLPAAAGGPASTRAHAANRDPGVNRHQYHQEQRIQQGVRSGELTREETKALAQEQRAIRQEERAYKSDGKLNKEERKDLHQDLNQASRNIYQEKHDGEKRN
jgi:polyhydroxyalkanoate synthesis regulator phasin